MRIAFNGRKHLIAAISLVFVVSIMPGLASCSGGAPVNPTGVGSSPTVLPKAVITGKSQPIPTNSSITASIVMPATDVKAGDAFNVSVRLSTETPSRGAQCGLTFDPKQMKCENVTEGAFFRDWAKANDCTTINYPSAQIDNVNGTVSDYGIAVMGTKAGGAAGIGVFCTYTFTAITSAITPPKLLRVLASDPAGSMSQAVVK